MGLAQFLGAFQAPGHFVALGLFQAFGLSAGSLLGRLGLQPFGLEGFALNFIKYGPSGLRLPFGKDWWPTATDSPKALPRPERPYGPKGHGPTALIYFKTGPSAHLVPSERGGLRPLVLLGTTCLFHSNIRSSYSRSRGT